jgi:aspartate aminotransferase
MQLSARSGRIAVSPTMKVAADAIKLKAQGIDVIDFGAGEPDFPTPAHIGAAAHRAIDANFTKDTANAGPEDLKRAIVERYRLDNGTDYTSAEVIWSAGGKQALFNSVLALFGPGDEVITHMPGWPTLVLLDRQGKVVFYQTGHDDTKAQALVQAIERALGKQPSAGAGTTGGQRPAESKKE